jgi:hypothetical protein
VVPNILPSNTARISGPTNRREYTYKVHCVTVNMCDGWNMCVKIRSATLKKMMVRNLHSFVNLQPLAQKI